MASMIQKWWWTIFHESYLLLREVDCTCTSEESQITSAVLWMNIHNNPGISQSLFVIPALVRRHSQVHPKFSPALRRAPKLIRITHIVLLYQSSEIPVTPIPVVRDHSYSEGLPEYPPRVWYSPEIDSSKFTLHILSNTPGVFQRLKYILLMEASYWLEWFYTCAVVAIVFALPNWGDLLPCHHMYRLSSSSSPSSRTWYQLNGETLAGKSAHCKVKWITRVGSYWIDKFNRG